MLGRSQEGQEVRGQCWASGSPLATAAQVEDLPLELTPASLFR